MLCTYISHVLIVNTLWSKYSHDMLYANKYSCVCVCVVCIKPFSKTKCQVFNFFSKTLTLKLKLK